MESAKTLIDSDKCPDGCLCPYACGNIADKDKSVNSDSDDSDNYTLDTDAVETSDTQQKIDNAENPEELDVNLGLSKKQAKSVYDKLKKLPKDQLMKVLNQMSQMSKGKMRKKGGGYSKLFIKRKKEHLKQLSNFVPKKNKR